MEIYTQITFVSAMNVDLISDVPNFHIQKISECEAITATQRLDITRCDSFETALKHARIAYKPENQLKEGEDYYGYIAVHINRKTESQIRVYWLDGSLCVTPEGAVVTANDEAILIPTNDLVGKLEDLVKYYGLSRKVKNEIITQLRKGSYNFVYIDSKWRKIVCGKKSNGFFY